ncbi:uncharacterized protein SAPINGB_P005351 [Magnusiomyces paraingens]|uniref:Uncharacterized protein n=1 Tax=Magnusiomyces paraingens TaxID=2606893 RepID=A0A5E8BZI9_9ASCO|nr:uncharacterized protein SAPINGB_P005351 [Saprochaete ingens]VVT56864.1 unnamed protein product [Saprochaete ingens]
MNTLIRSIFSAILLMTLFLSTTNAQVYKKTSATKTSTKTTATTQWPTSVWYTKVTAGVTTAYLSAFYQSFDPMYTALQEPSSGTIGLGTLSGTVGTVRPLKTLTVTTKH